MIIVKIRELTTEYHEQIKCFFCDVFTREPWNDDWSDEAQLDAYITDLTANRNSLVFGLFDEEKMVGLAIGSIRHWYTGTEYVIDEFCIKTEEQGRGLGTLFMQMIEKEITERGIKRIFLQTERTLPAYEFYKKNGFGEMTDHVSFAKRIAD